MNSTDALLDVETETDTEAVVDPAAGSDAAGALPSLPRGCFPLLTARTGKIARLPGWLRDQLNEKILNGVPGKELVGWLNGMPEARAVLRRRFEGKAITEQNLSAWRQGGYADWLVHYERRLWLLQAHEQSEDLQRDAGAQPLMETFGTMMEMILGQAVKEMLGRRLDLSSPQDMKQLLELSREVARHRRLSQAMMKERELKLHRKKQLRVALGPDDWNQVDEWEHEDLEKMYGSDEESEEDEDEDEEDVDDEDAGDEREEDDDDEEEEAEADPGESRQIAADLKLGAAPKPIMTLAQEEELLESLVSRLQTRLKTDLAEAGMTETDMAGLMKMARGKAAE